jgi:mono/diheme cytochrome c family protein
VAAKLLGWAAIVRLPFSCCAAAALFVALVRALSAQSAGAANLKTGKEIYEAGCAGCHGGDGTGALQSTIAFEKPNTFPDFTQCSQTTPEDNYAWKSVIRDGGPSRGFSPIMPAFGAALSPAQIEAVVGYVRGFCKERGWPRGELNLPRALVTEKAYPENEVVITTAINVTGTPAVENEIVYEQRFGRRNQLEVSVPVLFERPSPGLWYGGIGDIGLGVKRVLFASLHSGSIFALQGEAILPTGNRKNGLGTGTTVFETFAAFGQLFPHKVFLQLQGGGELPVDTSRAPQAVFFRVAAGKSFNQNHGLGRLWSPMVEFLTDRELVNGAHTDFDVVPQFQVTLSKRQHVRFNLGVRIPATNTTDRSVQAVFYLLWDFQDGKLLEGWR